MKWFPLNRRLLLGQRPTKSQLVDLPLVKDGHKFDEATGQVYTETIIPITSGNDRNWTRNRRVVRERYEKDFIGYEELFNCTNVGALKGARSLQDVAIESILQNISDITQEILESLPAQLLDRIWFEVNRSGKMSFDIWRIFSKLLLDQGDTTLRLMRYREAIEQPNCPLEIYTIPLTSISLEFITTLSLTILFPLSDLVKLSSIANLGVLEIVNISGKAQREVGDRLIRAWNIAALNDGAFKVLRILRLWNHVEVTSKSLIYLNSFPALGIYDVRGCGFDARVRINASALGWQATVDPNILGVLQAACVTRALQLQRELGKGPKPIRRVSADQLWDGAKVWRLPRKDIPHFLTRDATSRPGTPRSNRQSYIDMHRMVDKLQTENPDLDIKKYRWETLDRHIFAETRMKQTWEFQNYTAFARLGEMRNDSDLKRAGIELGDQAMVNDELVNSVPMVSIRLGPTTLELRPSSGGNGSHKPFYSSIFNSSNSSLTRLTNDWQTPYTGLNPQSLSFIRIDIAQAATHPTPKQEMTTNTSENGPPLKRKRASVTNGKRMKLGDVLGSFL